jgi:STE24 endopeptidase
VSRILLLLILVLWMARTAGPPASGFAPTEALITFFGGIALIVLFMGVWSRVLARRVSGQNLHRSVWRFTRAMYAARLFIPTWFAVGLFALGWGDLVDRNLGVFTRWPVELPAAIVGTLPALLGWMGLWWAQYPADRALREQSMLAQLNDDLPIHSPPGLRSYFWTNFRLQILFTLVPIGLILLLRDAACMGLWASGVIQVNPLDGSVHPQGAEIWVTLGALATVFLLVPEILRHVLHTQPLPPGALRNRLEALCRRSGLRYREILLWHTDYAMGNAAVMGMFWPVRYILLSDLLLETMTNEQIEAVFAHEIGHVVHRHMTWYVVFFAIIMAGLFGPVEWVSKQLGRNLTQGNLNELVNLLAVVTGCGGFFFLFGCLSRWFERQADVYAARTMQRYENLGMATAAMLPPEAPASVDHARSRSYVGPYGAQLFASALHRVAVINNIPLEPRQRERSGLLSRLGLTLDTLVERTNDWFHGSIPTRMNYLRDLSSDPRRTSEFDRTMGILYSVLLIALVFSGAVLLLMQL